MDFSLTNDQPEAFHSKRTQQPPLSIYKYLDFSLTHCERLDLLNAFTKLILPISSSYFEHANLSTYSDALTNHIKSDPYISTSVVIACLAGWLNKNTSEDEAWHQTLLELLRKHLPTVFDMMDDHVNTQAVLDALVRVLCSPPEIRGNYGTRQAIECTFQAAPLIPNPSSMIQLHRRSEMVITFLQCTRNDLSLATLTPGPWKLLTALSGRALTHLWQPEALHQVLQLTSVTLLEGLCQHGLLAVSLHIDKNKIIYACTLLSASRLHDIGQFEPMHSSTLVLLALILVRAYRLSHHPTLHSQSIKLCKLLLLNASTNLTGELELYLHRTHVQHQQWLEELRENSKELAADLVLFIWQSQELLSFIQPVPYLNLLFDSLPYLVSEIQNRVEAYSTLLSSCFSCILFHITAQDQQTGQDHHPISMYTLSDHELLLPLIEKPIFENVFSNHPLAHNISLDLWCLLCRSSNDTAQIRHAKALTNLIHTLEASFYPNEQDSPIPISITFQEISLHQKLVRITERIHATFRIPAQHAFIAEINEFAHKTVQSAQHMIDIIPLYDGAWNDYYSFVFESSIHLQQAANTKIQKGTWSHHLALQLRIISKILHYFSAKISPKAISDAGKTVFIILGICKQSTHEIDGSLLQHLLDVLMNARSRIDLPWTMLITLMRNFVPRTSPLGKIAICQFVSTLAGQELLTNEAWITIAFDVTEIFKITLNDSDWVVVVMAIINYQHIKAHNSSSVPLTIISNIDQLITSSHAPLDELSFNHLVKHQQDKMKSSGLLPLPLMANTLQLLEGMQKYIFEMSAYTLDRSLLEKIQRTQESLLGLKRQLKQDSCQSID